MGDRRRVLLLLLAYPTSESRNGRPPLDQTYEWPLRRGHSEAMRSRSTRLISCRPIQLCRRPLFKPSRKESRDWTMSHDLTLDVNRFAVMSGGE
jgi:hypothetical protein